jgi:hypothetical protein
MSSIYSVKIRDLCVLLEWYEQLLSFAYLRFSRNVAQITGGDD